MPKKQDSCQVSLQKFLLFYFFLPVSLKVPGENGESENNQTNIHMISATTTTTTNMKFRAELTDTFAGEANYSWVRRVEFEAPETITDRALVRLGKAVLGLSGVRCVTYNHGDMLELRPVGSCTVMFLSAAY
jgi:hypothetical protein